MTKIKDYSAGLLLLIIIALPLFITNNYFIRLLSTMGIYLIIVMGLNILIGYTGLISIGQAGTFAVGAYSAALLMTKTPLPFGIVFVIAILEGILVGAFIGIVCLKLKNAYLAIVTLAFSLIIQTIVVNWRDVTGGMEGFLRIPKPSLFGFTIDTPIRGYYMVFVMNIIVFFIIRNILKSNWGRNLRAVRDDEIAAKMMGINIVRSKVFSFIVASTAAAISGCLYATLYGAIFPDYFNMDLSTLFLSMIVIGGVGTIAGPIIGTMLITLILEVFNMFGQVQMLFYGITLIIVCVVEPAGIIELFNRLRRRLVSKH